MNFKILKANNLIGFLSILLFSVCDSCVKPRVIPIDKVTITNFHQKNIEPTIMIGPNVNLFIDYSTCVVDAVRSSAFFHQIRSRITGLIPTPTLYGLKGQSIVQIGNNMDVINQELNNIHEISYANIEGACHQICMNNEQAILITDGEYWTAGIGERTDLAYLKDSFVKWISKGFEIYVYIESYIEKYNGNNYNKKRFYFLFTDDKIQNNIYQELNKAFSVSPINSSLKLIKLSNSDIQPNGKFSINQDLSSTVLIDENFSAYEIGDDWDTIDEFILNAKDPNTGISIPGGGYLLNGLKLTSNPLSPYTYAQLDLKVYQVSENFINKQKIDFNANEVNDIFTLDNNLYKKSGEIGIKILGDYSKSLSKTSENLLRIDIIAKTVNKKLNRADFEWKSLSVNGTNSSVFESILQTIDNDKIDPGSSQKILYTLYLKTSPLK